MLGNAGAVCIPCQINPVRLHTVEKEQKQADMNKMIKGKSNGGFFPESKPLHAAKVFTTTNYTAGTLYALQAAVVLYY